MSEIVFDLGELKLPASFITSGTTILGQPESGKTNACRRIAEQALEQRVPIVVVDRKGDFWGLRLKPDGQPTGWDIAIFGGDHGDLELTEDSGRALADAIVENHASAILDLSHFEHDAAAARFVTAFAKRLLFLKKDDPYPMLVILDEADLYASKVVRPGEAQMVGAVLNLRKLGRKRGIGVVANAQRSARLHQDLIDMADLLIMTQSAGRRDQETLRATLKDQMSSTSLSELLRAVSRLQKGEAFAYSPSKFDVMQTVKMAKAESFDSSATPEFGKDHAQVKLGRIDIDALRETISRDGINLEKADLNELIAQIQVLRAHRCPEIAPPLVETVTETVEVPVVTDEDRAAIAVIISGVDQLLRETRDLDHRIAARVAAGPEKSMKVRTSERRVELPKAAHAGTAIAPEQRAGRERRDENGELKPYARKLLNVLAQYPEGATQKQLAIAAGVRSNSGSFFGALATLRRLELISYGQPIRITEAGRYALGPIEPLPTGEALREYWFAKLDPAPSKFLRTLCGVYPRALSQDEMAAKAGYSQNSGSVFGAVALLRALKLVDGPGSALRASESLY